MRSLTVILGCLTVATTCLAQTPIFVENFSGYVPGGKFTQAHTGLDIYGQGSVPGWTGGGRNHSVAVDLDRGTGNDFALLLFSGVSQNPPNTLTLNTGIAANNARTVYEVSFDTGPTVFQVAARATSATDGLLIEILRVNNSVLASKTHRPGAWPGTRSSQALISPGVFTYTGDGSGNVTIRLSTNPTYSGRLSGAIDNLRVAELTLTASPPTISIANGGTQTLTLKAGARHANRSYWMFGSMTGTKPGINLLGVHIPLNPDPYTDLVIGFANGKEFKDFKRTLSTTGTATASLNVPKGLPILVGFKLYHAYVVYDGTTGQIFTSSNPVSVEFK